MEYKRKNSLILFFLLISVNNFASGKKRKFGRSRSKIVKKMKKNKKYPFVINRGKPSFEESLNQKYLSSDQLLFENIINEIEIKINQNEILDIKNIENIKKQVEDTTILINQEIMKIEFQKNQIESYYNTLKEYETRLKSIKNKIEDNAFRIIDNKIEKATQFDYAEEIEEEIPENEEI